MTAPSTRRMILAGGGHAQIAVLRSLAMAPLADCEITLINPQRETFYTGMLPGVLAGLLAPDECSLDVAALAARARIRFLEDAIVGMDAAARSVRLESGTQLPFDVLSLDIGSQLRDAPDPQLYPHVIPVRPLRFALPRIHEALEQVRDGVREPTILIIGGGAGGVELAFGFRAALAGTPDVAITLLQSGAQILPDVSRMAQQRTLTLLDEYEIEVRRGLGRLEPDHAGVRTAAGEVFGGSTVIWATGAAPFSWLADSGLVTTGDGFLLCGSDLRCRGTDGIFAAGDTAQLDQHNGLPRSGVHAVRQGPILAHNLRAAMRNQPRFQNYRPQRDFLRLLSTGDNRALAIYRGRAYHGRPWWALKKWIDRRFLARYRPPRVATVVAPDPAMQANMGECGGCSAKVPPGILDQVIFGQVSGWSEPAPPTARSELGLADRDDAAIFLAGDNRKVVVTTDAFPPFADDFALVAEIAAINAASDIYAMGGVPRQALILAGVPEDSAGDLEAFLRGARRACEELGVEILGGHSVQVDTPLIGYTVFGELNDPPMTKAGAEPGDLLVLTKPLGTGILLAAARGGECPALWWDQMIASMRQNNAEAAKILRAAGAHACTDISGFGLLGHTLEMLLASGVHATLSGSGLPVLAGAYELAAAGWAATGSSGLRTYLEQLDVDRASDSDGTQTGILIDPQTSGGLLAAIPPEAARSMLQDPRTAEFRIIGEVREASFQAQPISLDLAPAP